MRGEARKNNKSLVITHHLILPWPHNGESSSQHAMEAVFQVVVLYFLPGCLAFALGSEFFQFG